jgi:hypothetical protein
MDMILIFIVEIYGSQFKMVIYDDDVVVFVVVVVVVVVVFVVFVILMNRLIS